MVTKTAATIWELNSGELSENKDADLVIVKNEKDKSFYDLFFETNPEDILMVVSKGSIRMFDPSLLVQLKQMGFNETDYSTVNLKGTIKYVAGDLPKLIKDIHFFYPKAILPFGS